MLIRPLLQLVLVINLCIFAGCGGETTAPSVVKETTSVESIDFSNVTTTGNHSYIPIEKSGSAAHNHKLILEVLDKFEREHPQYEVTGWQIEARQYARQTQAHTYGLWVDHQPKQY